MRGFFTTGNSAGSFAILAFFAGIVLLVEKLKNRKNHPFGYLWLFACIIVVSAILFSLVITRSKGAIIAALIAAVMFITYLLFGSWLKAHKKAILVACLLLIVAGGCVVVSYGLTHSRLPNVC